MEEKKKIDKQFNLKQKQNACFSILPQDFKQYFVPLSFMIYTKLYEISDVNLNVEASILRLAQILRLDKRKVQNGINQLITNNVITKVDTNYYHIAQFDLDRQTERQSNEAEYYKITYNIMYDIINTIPDNLNSYNAFSIYIFITHHIWSAKGFNLSTRFISDGTGISNKTICNYIDYLGNYFDIKDPDGKRQSYNFNKKMEEK